MAAYKPKLDKEKMVLTHKHDGKDWIDCDLKSELVEAPKFDKMSFYTQNIWFSKKNAEERFTNLMQMIEESKADFV